MMSPRPAAVWLALGSLSTLAIIKAYEKYQNTEKGSKAVTTPTKTTSVASASVVAAGVAAAVKVMSLACCKHSKYNVGACLTALDDNKEGEIRYYTGVNVESDTFGLTCCGERGALFKALSEGEGHRHFRHDSNNSSVAAKRSTFIHLAVATRDGGISCGACRQLLCEYCPASMPVLFTDDEGRHVRSTTVGAMMPDPFVLV